MSRNIGGKYANECDQCGGEVEMVEAARPITEADCGLYMPEYNGMRVANAECRECGAKYLAWCYRPARTTPWSDSSGRQHFYPSPAMGEPDGSDFFDLSYRSTFNDEPGADDLPDPERFAKTPYGRWLAYHKRVYARLMDAGIAVDDWDWEDAEKLDDVLRRLFTARIEVEFKKVIDP